ncbi:DUF1704 domain-containing protein [Patescibacteria group bacterium]|nr:DUF1704 domain-containing protein [Patescibacteria group bacterium]
MLSSAKKGASLHKIRVFLKTFHYFSPTNLHSEREKFIKSNFYNPQLSYPALPINKLRMFEETLKSIGVPDTTDLASIIQRKKIEETSLKLKLFLALGKPGISEISKKLYQVSFDERSLTAAKEDATKSIRFKPQEDLQAADTLYAISEYLKGYQINNWRVEISDRGDFYFQVRPRKKLITISNSINWDGGDLDTVLAHEIDGHVLRAINAKRQELPFSENFPFYIKTEEGLACYLSDFLSENGELSLKHHAIKYLGGYYAQEHSFRETYNFFLDYGFTKELAFQRTLRLKRGLADTSIPGLNAREAMYYEGMLEVKDYLDTGGNIQKLFAGKIGLADLELVPIPENQIIPERLLKN